MISKIFIIQQSRANEIEKWVVVVRIAVWIMATGSITFRTIFIRVSRAKPIAIVCKKL